MPASRINVRKLKDAVRPKLEGGLRCSQIATALGISKGVITKYVGLAVRLLSHWFKALPVEWSCKETLRHGAAFLGKGRKRCAGMEISCGLGRIALV